MSHSGSATGVSPDLTSARTFEKWIGAAFLVIFLVSSGAAAPAPASAGVPLYQLSHGAAPALVPQQEAPPQGGAFFFASVTVGNSPDTNPGAGPLSELQAQLPQGLPPVPSGANVVFVRQGDSYLVLAQAGGNDDGSSPFLQSSSLPRVWMDAGGRRSRFRIHVEILEALKCGAMTPFEIAFRLRLNTKRTKRYLELLAKKELLELCVKDGKSAYGLTANGWAFAENVRSAMILDS